MVTNCVRKLKKCWSWIMNSTSVVDESTKNEIFISNESTVPWHWVHINICRNHPILFFIWLFLCPEVCNPFWWSHMQSRMFAIAISRTYTRQTAVWLQSLPRQGLYSLSGKTSYRQISWSLEATRLDVIMIISLWKLTCISAALPVKFQSDWESLNPNFGASRLHEILR